MGDILSAPNCMPARVEKAFEAPICKACIAFYHLSSSSSLDLKISLRCFTGFKIVHLKLQDGEEFAWRVKLDNLRLSKMEDRRNLEFCPCCTKCLP